ACVDSSIPTKARCCEESAYVRGEGLPRQMQQVAGGATEPTYDTVHPLLQGITPPHKRHFPSALPADLRTDLLTTQTPGAAECELRKDASSGPPAEPRAPSDGNKLS